ncbi:MAG: tyrosine-type recombinase/integrase [Pseudomonadota bacterium]
MIIKLTDSIVTRLECPPDKSRMEWCDSEFKGMYILGSAKGNTLTYYLRYKDGQGKTCHQKIGRTTDMSLAEARKQAKLLKADIVANGRNPRAEAKALKATLTMDELWLEYETYAKPRKRSFSRDEQIYRLQIQPTLGKVRINQVTRQQIQTLMTMHKQSGLANASVDHVAKLIRRMLGLAVQWEMLQSNVASRIELFGGDNKIEHYLDDEQLMRLVGVLQTYPAREVALICMFLLATGCRVNEALTAEWGLVDRPNRIWRVAAINSKSGKSRVVPLSDTALNVLDQMGTEGKFQHVFINPDTGKPYTHIRHTWKRIRAKAGMPWLRLHDLRHSFASMLVNAGCSLYVVQQALGHADSRVTQRYAHLSSKTLQDAANSASVKILEAIKKVA